MATMTAQAITRALGGRWHGGYGMANCPCHDDRDPSCKVTDDDRKSDGIDVFCFAGCSWQDIKADLRRRGLLPDFERGRESLSPTKNRAVHVRAVEPEPEPEPDDDALAIWRAS